MSRCVYDGVFYRVFFIILLAVAFTFTVILTNVFVDIDGLLANEDRGKQNEHDMATTQETPVEQKTEATIFVLPANVAEVRRDFDVEEKQETANDVKTFEDEEDASYRTKRSLDSTNFQFHIKDQKIKNILTNRLATLLEELDNEETDNNKLDNTTPKDVDIKLDACKPLKDITVTKTIVNDKIENDKKEKELLHLTMHNILLQGIIGHMDLNDVYKKVHNLVQNMDAEEKKIEKDKELQKLLGNSEEQTKDTADIEKMFLEELVKCAKLQKQIVEKNNHKSTEKPPAVQKVPKMLIKTVIDISSLRNKENETSPKEIRGIIKFLYNGKAVKFKQTDDQDDQENSETQIPHITTNNQNANKFLKAIEVSDFIKDNIHIPNSIINNAIADYFSKNAEIANLFKNTSMKRSKRNVKIKKPHDQNTTDKIKIKSKNDKNQDEDLYVEIETHFDGKGIQGEKKRRLIKSIIQKIQKAIRSDMKNMHEKKMPKKYHLKKRFQAPLDNRERILIDKFLIPFDAVVKRELTPISKIYPVNAEAPYFHDKSGETWKSMLFGPRFLSSSKGINSAELGQVDVHYEKEHSGSMISPRMQKPLNDDAVDGDMNSFYELGNLKFYIKDLDGSGFSIGFNQFVGEAPDDESINTFTGVENLLKRYRSKYDDDEGKPVILKRNVKFVEKDNKGSAEEIGEEFSNEDDRVNEHNIKRRNVDPDDQDHHLNEYKIIFSNNFLPYETYQEVIEDRNKKISVSLQKDNSTSTYKKILLIGKTIDKALKPSEIFSLADMIGKRKKRSLKVKKYSRMNIGSKMNKFFHTNSKVIRTIYLKNGVVKNNKRNKRQVEKIRIVATDNSVNVPIPRSSDENIFLVSDENLFSDHAVIREMPEEAVEEFERHNEEYAVPAEEEKPHHHTSDFNGKARHNILMSKYPHVFMEEIGRSKEEESDTPENVFSKYYDAQNYYEPPKPEYHQAYKRIIHSSTENPDNANNVQEIVDAISPRTNYKLTVKILPKNATSVVNEGFKEVHTSINKSVSKNGLIISSQVNVSEFSKVEKINKNYSSTSATDPPSTTLSPLVKHIRHQQDKMNIMLKQHRLRIEEQLEHLNKERQTIETYMGAKLKEPSISVWLPTNPPQKLHLTKDEAGQLITSALLKLRDAPHLNELSPPTERFPFMNPPIGVFAPPMVAPMPPPLASPIAPPMPPPMALSMPPPSPPPPPPSPTPTPSSPPTTTPLPSSPPPTQPRQDLEKIRLVNTILHNENLTNTILTKIDKNTRTLQAFLQKLTERLEYDKILKKNEDMLRKNEDHILKPNNVYSKDYGPFVHKPYNAPNADLDKNETHVSIPFVYAYQQSFPTNKANVPVASIVYQGHIHANEVTNNELLKHHPKSHATIHFTNDSRFFIDDLESVFNKASPMKREDLGDLTIVSDKKPLMKIPLRNITGV